MSDSTGLPIRIALKTSNHRCARVRPPAQRHDAGAAAYLGHDRNNTASSTVDLETPGPTAPDPPHPTPTAPDVANVRRARATRVRPRTSTSRRANLRRRMIRGDGNSSAARINEFGSRFLQGNLDLTIRKRRLALGTRAIGRRKLQHAVAQRATASAPKPDGGQLSMRRLRRPNRRRAISFSKTHRRQCKRRRAKPPYRHVAPVLPCSICSAKGAHPTPLATVNDYTRQTRRRRDDALFEMLGL